MPEGPGLLGLGDLTTPVTLAGGEGRGWKVLVLFATYR